MTTLVDTNILIYHTKGEQIATSFLSSLLSQQALHLSILTKIEFLGWDKHTVIAATALLNNLKLATRNEDDFRGIEGLEIINPFE